MMTFFNCIIYKASNRRIIYEDMDVSGRGLF